MTANVLGVKYTITESNRLNDYNLESNDGYCDPSTKSIVIDTFQESPDSMKDLESYRKHVIRHELIHAFLYESGLDGCSWAKDEQIVDWIAIQFPKLKEIFEKINVL